MAETASPMRSSTTVAAIQPVIIAEIAAVTMPTSPTRSRKPADASSGSCVTHATPSVNSGVNSAVWSAVRRTKVGTRNGPLGTSAASMGDAAT